MNQTRLSAVIAERSALRYTPAGLPALDLMLEHQSSQSEAGHERQVSLRLRALAIGTQAEQLAHHELGRPCRFQGFLVSPRQGKSVVLHIQNFQQD